MKVSKIAKKTEFSKLKYILKIAVMLRKVLKGRFSKKNELTKML